MLFTVLAERDLIPSRLKVAMEIRPCGLEEYPELVRVFYCYLGTVVKQICLYHAKWNYVVDKDIVIALPLLNFAFVQYDEFIIHLAAQVENIVRVLTAFSYAGRGCQGNEVN